MQCSFVPHPEQKSLPVTEVLQQLTGSMCVQVSLLQALAGGLVPVQALDGRQLQVCLGVDVLDMSCLHQRMVAMGSGR